LTANDSYSGAALGATPFELHDLPSAGWMAGDEVLIPESRQVVVETKKTANSFLTYDQIVKMYVR